ncbi:MAG: PAT family beta-lactamase induction signal transducer AmpG [Brevundimonas sp.]|jgi:PAT family beta-lactamase induction signal transducer AmpG|uniref:AmpG family muropeptide MFS transporter n=1 Tax=Brevundimonas sp. TaxID=1871086 RepID=UPI0024887E46|nr:MFS transporter [Brevundimonas sp.]MDI1280396.1 MFS transporter [Brevundimonas sp.]
MTETPAAQTAEPDIAPKGLAVLKAAFRDRRTLAMLLLGFSAGLPFTMLIGTLNAWLGEAGVSIATIGILSWIGLFAAFKFLWSPVVNLFPPVIGRRVGRRRSWMLGCQLIIGGALLVIAVSSPEGGTLGLLAGAAALGAFASATQDIVIDTWRIEVAGPGAPIDLLSTIYQFGFRTAALVGGAGALLLADVAGWPATFTIAGLLMGLGLLGTIIAPEPEPAPPQAIAKERLGSPKLRLFALIATLAAWIWAAFMLINFMVTALNTSPAPSATEFTATWGPWIIAAAVLLPCGLAGFVVWRGRQPTPATDARPLVTTLYDAILAPLVELMGRLGWGALIVLGLILTYRITDGVWGPFAYPFYMGDVGGALGHTKTEVALASKTFGVVMTILGIGLGGWALLAIGRMASLVVGAVLAAATNLLFADLAMGAPVIGSFMASTGLYALFGNFGIGEPMARLMLAIAGENIAGGFAGAAFVAYLSALSSKMFGAVQFAVFTSLALLIGTLGRGALGEMIETHGFAWVFVFAAALGGVTVIFCVLEWIRLAAGQRKMDAEAG